MNASSSSQTVDLNADLGEGFPNDLPLLDRVSSANVSCGAHAGTIETILAAMEAARVRSVVVGAHPGYDDREHFGRRERSLSRESLRLLLASQLAGFLELAERCRIPIAYLKPHGALYNQAQRDETVARAIVEAVAPLGWAIVGQPGGRLEILAEKNGLRYIREGFIDRRYLGDGRLVSRTESNAVLTDPREIEDQIPRLVATGFDTLCVHGDDPRAVESADLVRRILKDRGIAIRSFIREKGAQT